MALPEPLSPAWSVPDSVHTQLTSLLPLLVSLQPYWSSPSWKYDDNAVGDPLCTYCLQSCSQSYPLSSACSNVTSLDFIGHHFQNYSFHSHPLLVSIMPSCFISFMALIEQKLLMIWFCYLITHLLAVFSHLNVSPRRAGTLSFLLPVCLQYP